MPVPSALPLLNRAAALAGLACAALCFAAPSVAYAAAAPAASAAARDGLSLMRESERRDSGYADFTASIDMEIAPKSGSPLKRHMRLSNLEARGDGAKMLLLFENPPDVKGTVLLSHAHRKAADEQWIYLPAFKRVKKIAESAKASPFMASDFSYEDILSMNPRVDKYAYALLPDAAWEGQPCFVIERKPLEAGSGYSRQVVWMDTADYLIRKIDFFAPDGGPSKTLEIRGYKEVKPKHWRAGEMKMKNLKTGGETVLRGSDYKLGTGLDASAFDPSALNK